MRSGCFVENLYITGVFCENLHIIGLESKLFFYRGENRNSPKLQGGKDILTLYYNRRVHL